MYRTGIGLGLDWMFARFRASVSAVSTAALGVGRTGCTIPVRLRIGQSRIVTRCAVGASTSGAHPLRNNSRFYNSYDGRTHNHKRSNNQSGRRSFSSLALGVTGSIILATAMIVRVVTHAAAQRLIVSLI